MWLLDGSIQFHSNVFFTCGFYQILQNILVYKHTEPFLFHPMDRLLNDIDASTSICFFYKLNSLPHICPLNFQCGIKLCPPPPSDLLHKKNLWLITIKLKKYNVFWYTLLKHASDRSLMLCWPTKKGYALLAVPSRSHQEMLIQSNPLHKLQMLKSVVK